LVLAACTSQTPPPDTGLSLTRTDFQNLPGWQDGDLKPALASFARSCGELAKKSPTQTMAYAGTIADWLPVCARAQGDARLFFERNFTPYAVGGQALFTGYYEPEISGSRTRHGDFQTPVYGSPSDQVSVDLGRFIPKLQGEHVSGRLAGQNLAPYPTRAEIDAKGIAGAKILFWCDDPVALFFLQIQGSGRARFDDGSSGRIAYAGTNGRPYTAIGRALIVNGALTRENVSLATIRAWLKANPSQAQAVMEMDQSFVFFQEAPLGDALLGSPGTLGAALTPLASMAVDAHTHPLGAPFYVAAQGPDPVSALLIGQDTGGAIRGAARGDIFFGFGPDAERRAGDMKAPGTLYVLVPNSVAQAIGSGKTIVP
jgi:membrane-bound lytic murein transglycosylase A